MPNTSVLTGADGSITLSTPQGPEGESAQAVLDAYELISVGRVQNVSVEVHSEVRAYHEIGQRYATELRPGNVNIRGTIGRAFLNGALIRLMLGEAADQRPAASWTQPAINITLRLDNPAVPDTSSTITLYDVKFEGWAFNIPEDDFVMESVSFKALFMSTQDEG